MSAWRMTRLERYVARMVAAGCEPWFIVFTVRTEIKNGLAKLRDGEL
jgi:hypothetical protein